MDTRFEHLRQRVDGRAQVAPEFWTAPGLPAEAIEDETAQLAGEALQGLTPGARVAHLGCGVGRLTRGLAAQHSGVVGIDISPALLAAGLPASRLWPGPPAPLPGGPYAGVVLDSRWLGWPAPELAAVIHAVAGSLEPSGWLRFPALVDPQADGGGRGLLIPRAHPHATWSGWLTTAGLSVPALAEPGGWYESTRAGVAGPAPALPRNHDDCPVDGELLYAHWMMAADEAAARGDVRCAEGCLEAACAAWPAGREGWLQWTFHRLSQGDLKGAAVLTEAWTDECPEDAEGWLRRAEVAEARERPDEARAALSRLRTLAPLEPHLRASAAALASALDNG